MFKSPTQPRRRQQKNAKPFSTSHAHGMTDISCILPDKLFLGALNAAQDLAILNKHSITAVLTVTSSLLPPLLDL
jgi:hypothetical protein